MNFYEHTPSVQATTGAGEGNEEEVSWATGAAIHLHIHKSKPSGDVACVSFEV